MSKVTIRAALNQEDEPEKPKKETEIVEAPFTLVARGSGDLKKKYRPQTLRELAPTCSIEQLQRLIDNPESSQVFLFEGKTGTGKTTCARIIARANVCLSESGEKPCLSCKACKIFEKSGDFLEINTANHRKLDDIRKLTEDMRYLPSELKFKVYILDEVQQLTPDAQQALLKVLEEPPRYLLIFLCTTDKGDLNQALLDRANTITFNGVTPKDAQAIIDQILAAANKTATQQMKTSFFKNSRGSVRRLVNNVQSFLEGGYDPDKTDEDEVTAGVRELAIAILKKDWSKVVGCLRSYEIRKNPEGIRIGLESYFRGVLLNKDIGEATHIGKQMLRLTESKRLEPSVSQYNSLVLSCLRACNVGA
jgi:DNA polymerase-3 subunit gamma/tau